MADGAGRDEEALAVGATERGLTIGELAERVGVTPRTVRFYVAEGLLPAPGGAGQNRVYTREHELRLRLIRRLKEQYLPLSEIRARLEGLAPEELEELVRNPPAEPPATSALEYLARLLEPGPPAPAPAGRDGAAGESQPAQPAAAAPPEAYPAACAPKRAMKETAPPSAEPAPSPDLWRRVPLAPGVELHYQPSGDSRRDNLIARLIREATRLLKGDER